MVDEHWNNSEFNRNRTFWHQNKKKESQKECQKRKKKKPKEDQKEIGLVVLSALFLGNQMGMPSPDWFCLRFGDDAKMSNEFTKIMSKRGAKRYGED